MPLENERGVQTNWNVPLSVPTFTALPAAAPIGVIVRLEDVGTSVQWDGTTWVGVATGNIGQTTWFIDEQNLTGVASDLNDGRTVSTPLRTDAARDSRMGGINANWNGEYHLRYLSDVNNPILLRGNRTTATIFIHGSATNFTGQTTLYTGTIDALTALNRNAAAPAGGQPILITSNGLPVSWTASGLNRLRMRRTSDNATGYVLKDLGAKQCRSSEWSTAPTGFTAPYNFTCVAATPNVADTFVVETLTKLKSVVIAFNAGGSPSSTFNPIVCDSVEIGETLLSVSGIPSVWRPWGCHIRNSAFTACQWGSFTLDSCRLFPAAGTASVMPESLNVSMQGGVIDSNGQANSTCFLNCAERAVLNRVMTQDVRLLMVASGKNTGIGPSGQGWSIQSLGVFDSPSNAIEAMGPNAFFLFNNSAVIWGSGNTGFSILQKHQGSWTYNPGPLVVLTHLNIVSTGGDMQFTNARGACRVFDDSVGTYTAARTLSFANLIATIATTGFSAVAGFPQFFDPVSGCGVNPAS